MTRNKTNITLYIDENILIEFKKLCLDRKTFTSREVQKFMIKELEKIKKETEQKQNEN